MNDVLSAGQAVYITGGMNVVIQAGMQFSLAGPGGFIDIGPAGVAIQGTMVLINSGGAPAARKAPARIRPRIPKIPTPPTTVRKVENSTNNLENSICPQQLA